MICLFEKWFRPRGHSKGTVLGYRTLSCGTDIIEYTGPISDVQDEIRGLAASVIIADEWEVYNFTEEVFEEVRKIETLRLQRLMNEVTSTTFYK